MYVCSCQRRMGVAVRAVQAHTPRGRSSLQRNSRGRLHLRCPPPLAYLAAPPRSPLPASFPTWRPRHAPLPAPFLLPSLAPSLNLPLARLLARVVAVRLRLGVVLVEGVTVDVAAWLDGLKPFVQGQVLLRYLCTDLDLGFEIWE